MREKMVTMITKAFGRDNLESTLASNLAKDIEEAYYLEYNDTQHNPSLYKKKLTDLIFNVRDPKNVALRNNILNRVIKCSALIHMTNEEMANPELQSQRKENEQEKTKEMMENCLTGSQGSTAFRCAKCKKSNTKHYQMQTRSADEPMTIFITCIECGNRWRC